jgi:hypothetical protein
MTSAEAEVVLSVTKITEISRYVLRFIVLRIVFLLKKLVVFSSKELHQPYGNSGGAPKETPFSRPPPGQLSISQCLYYSSLSSHFQEKNVPSR